MLLSSLAGFLHCCKGRKLGRIDTLKCNEMRQDMDMMFAFHRIHLLLVAVYSNIGSKHWTKSCSLLTKSSQTRDFSAIASQQQHILLF